MNRDRSQVIELRLNHAEEMFALAQTDLFSEYRNFLTGVEYCISLLRSQPIRRPVRLELSLPSAEFDNALGGRLAVALRRYCTSASATTNASGARPGSAASARSGSDCRSWCSGTSW